MAAAQLAFAQYLSLDGCIASFDAEKLRRPYHRNCGCALHGCARGGPKGPPCCARLQPCPVGLGARGRGRLVVAAPVWSPSSVITTGGSRSCGGGAAFESEDDDGWCSLPFSAFQGITFGYGALALTGIDS